MRELTPERPATTSATTRSEVRDDHERSTAGRTARAVRPAVAALRPTDPAARRASARARPAPHCQRRADGPVLLRRGARGQARVPDVVLAAGLWLAVYEASVHPTHRRRRARVPDARRSVLPTPGHRRGHRQAAHGDRPRLRRRAERRHGLGGVPARTRGDVATRPAGAAAPPVERIRRAAGLRPAPMPGWP
jgi:hypothetical protein